MATCFGAVCMVWQPPGGDPLPSNVSFIGFRVWNVVQNQWLAGDQPATLLLSDGYTDVPIGIEPFPVKGDELSTCLSQFLSLVGVPSFYLAPVVQVIHSKAAAVAYEAATGGGTVTPIIAEIPFLWFFPALEVQQDPGKDNENEEDEDEDEITDDVVSIILEEDMEVEVEVEVEVEAVVPATEASIEALEKEKFNLEIVHSDDKCMICLEHLSVEIEVSRMPCSHVFHGDCIVQWLKNSHICPLCRFEMPVDPN